MIILKVISIIFIFELLCLVTKIVTITEKQCYEGISKREIKLLKENKISSEELSPQTIEYISKHKKSVE
jgi:hypothetical protein